MMRTSWYPELAGAMRFPSALAFAHVGAFHRTPDFSMRAPGGIDGLNTSWLEVDKTELADWCQSSSSEHGALVDLDALDLKSNRSEEVLSNLRPAVTSARERGARVVFISTRPLSEFPALAGSSILLDAETVSMKPVPEGVAMELSADLGMRDELSRQNTATFAAGSRALIWEFAEIDAMDIGGNRKRDIAAQREGKLARLIFDELGAELCTWLEYWLFECKQDSLSGLDIDETVVSPLRSAGVLAPLDDGSFKLLPVGHEQIWLAGLSESLSNVHEPPLSWTAVANQLFALEREIRHLLAGHYIDVLGAAWPETVLDQDRQGIIELARRDAIPTASTLSDVRSPLDWLQMSRLLELASAESDTHGRFLGLNEIEWRKLGDDLLPIRHRVAHMRLIRSNDLEIVRRHRRLIQLRKKLAEVTTGS